jgi:hypothetical protein
MLAELKIDGELLHFVNTYQYSSTHCQSIRTECILNVIYKDQNQDQNSIQKIQQEWKWAT